MGPAMEGINDALKAFPGHVTSKRTVAERGLEGAINVIPEPLVLPKFLQDGRNGSKGMLGPMQRRSVPAGDVRKGRYLHFRGLNKLDQEFHDAMPTYAGKYTSLVKDRLRRGWEFL